MRKFLFGFLSFLIIGVPTAVQIFGQTENGELLLNEIVMAAPGNDSVTGCEYVEFRAIPGIPLGNFTYVDVDGDIEQNAGTVNYIRSLQGVMPGKNGLIVLASGNHCRNFDSQSNVIYDSTFQIFSSRNNGTNSFLIFAGQLPYTSGQDIDRNDDGFEDSGAEVIDGVAVTDNNNVAQDIQYGQAKLERRPGTPVGEAINAVTRFRNEPTRNAVSSFYFGDLDSIPSTTDYSFRISSRSSNFPFDGHLTPGGLNTGYIYVAVSGRLTDSIGRGIGNSIITATSPNGEVYYSISRLGGYFRVSVKNRDSYRLAVQSKVSRFAERDMLVMHDITDLVFVPIE